MLSDVGCKHFIKTPLSPIYDKAKPTISHYLNECAAHLVGLLLRKRSLRVTFKSTNTFGSKLGLS